MKQTYIKEQSVGSGNYKSEAIILKHIHTAGQLRFPGKTYSEKKITDKQSAGHIQKEDFIMLDIFGALNY